MYTISRRDANGKITEEEFRSFPHAVNILLNYIYYPVHGDYTITFSHRIERRE